MPRERSRRWTRRRLLSVGGTAATGVLAGCTGNRSADAATETATTADATGEGDATTEGADDGTTTEAALGGHPAAAGVRDQPRFGPPPTEAAGTIIAFEDPSCPRCAAFETGTVPKLRERLGDRVSFVFRGYPVVYLWGEPATQAIEAAFARETAEDGTSTDNGTTPDDTTTAAGETTTATTTTPESTPYGYRQGSVGTWALIRHYFEEQDQFDEGNVLAKTRRFLAERTGLDADAVVADAEAKARDEAVQADLSAGEEAGVGRTTPTVFLFRDGEFRTRAKGSVSFRVIESALEL